MKEEASVIAEYLVGTDRTVHEVAHELGIDIDLFYTMHGFDYLYDEVDQCDKCGKWYRYDSEGAYNAANDMYLCDECRPGKSPEPSAT